MNRRYLVALSFLHRGCNCRMRGRRCDRDAASLPDESAREPGRSARDDHAARQRRRDSTPRRTRADLRRHGDRTSRRRALERRALRSRRAHLHADRLDDGAAGRANDHDASRRTRAADGRRAERGLPFGAVQRGDLRSCRRHFQRDRLDVGAARRAYRDDASRRARARRRRQRQRHPDAGLAPRFTILRAARSAAPAI